MWRRGFAAVAEKFRPCPGQCRWRRYILALPLLAASSQPVDIVRCCRQFARFVGSGGEAQEAGGDEPKNLIDLV
jgi:hypothetical protein